MNKSKNKSGITLIALVITIIVLLILAGVAINLAIGENGIFNQSKLAMEKYKDVQNKEEEQLQIATNAMLGNVEVREGTVTIDEATLQGILDRLVALEHSSKEGMAVPTGTIISYSANNVPTGYLKCEGQAVSRIDYADLFAKIGTTYGDGDGSITFNVPDLMGKFLKGSSSAGIAEHAGLPNITGSAGLNGPYTATWWSDSGVSGALGATLKGHNSYTLDSVQSNAGVFDTLTFDASRSNSIYGKSTTVTPENISVVYCIKY